MDETDLVALGAAAAAAKIASGELTSADLVKACLARIDALEPQVQAWAFLDREHTLDRARAADDARREGRGVGPLHGVPVG
ncbi:MAG TPA: amidase family protein, partial [Hyphomicrobiaceae bacterium]